MTPPRRLLSGSTTAVLLGGPFDGTTVDLLIRRILPSPAIWVGAYEEVVLALDHLRGDDWDHLEDLSARGWARYLRLPLLTVPRPGQPWEYAAG